MLTKALRRNSSETFMPQLATQYKAAQFNVLGATVYVAKSTWPKFSVLQDDLTDLGHSTRDYAYTITTALRGWVRQHNMTYIPAKTFCSEWAYQKYLKLQSKSSVILSNDKQETSQAELIQAELMVARLYINDNRTSVVRMRDVIEQIKPLLSPAWVTMYESRNPERKKLIEMALETLRLEYHVRGELRDYNDFLDALR